MIVTSTQKEGSSYYHIYDNRVFPKHIDDIVECPQEVFEDPNYRIDDRNINSAIQSPTHCAKVPISQESFTVGGYAYNGGGMPVHRVEITLNGGINWRSRISRSASVHTRKRWACTIAGCFGS